MKNLLKIWALSLALIAVVFMLNTNAETANGDVQLKINPKQASCTYGTSVNLGMTGFSYTSQVMTTGFQAGDADAWSCEDTEGDSGWSLWVQMLTNLVNMDNNTYYISGENVLITNPQATSSTTPNACTPDEIVNALESIDTITELFGKASAMGEVCTITTSKVDITVNVPSSQQVGAYSGTLQVSYDGTLGNTEMN